MKIKELIERFPEKFSEYAEKILDSYFGNITVFLKNEEILYVNSKFAESIHMTKDQVYEMSLPEMKSKKMWARSMSNEMEEKRQPFNAYNVTKWGDELFTHIEPIFNDNGEMIMTAQFSIPRNLISYFAEYVREESSELSRYKEISKFLGEGQKERIILNSPASKSTFAMAKYISDLDSTVLIQGGTGTGKDVLAKYIYNNSHKSSNAFIPVNCSAIPEELVESELFGYEKGAFTGASNTGKPGLFEIANHGTIFLDEIGELPLTIQAKFLRVLESGEFIRVGGTKVLHTDVRVIAATNRDLKQMVKDNQFREDLYYRLSVMPLVLPPLKERVEDIIELAEYFLESYNRKYGIERDLTDNMKQLLLSYHWPGNIRELRNVIERYVISGNWDITLTSFDPQRSKSAVILPNITEGLNLHEACDRFEKDYISKALEACNGSVAGTAEQLGIHRSLLYKKLDKYGIKNK